MNQTDDQVEGQSIARAILANAESAWDRFEAQYREMIVDAAEKRARSSKLRSEFDCDDIVQGFYSNQLLDRPVRMFGPVAEGQRPLTPRLLDSLKNYCNSLHRRRKRFEGLSTHQGDTIEDTGYISSKLDSEDASADLKFRFSEQLSVIRSTFAAPSRAVVPQREVLLLSERLILAETFATSHCRNDASADELAKVQDAVIALHPWSSEEASTSIPEVNEPLLIVWGLLVPEVFTVPFGADGYSIAECLRIHRNTWDKWVQRARECVVKFAGARKTEALFPYWPTRLFQTESSRSQPTEGA